MGKKKPIQCFDCPIDCIEVGRAIGYPKEGQQPYQSTEWGHKYDKYGHEYRYVCPKCGKEYIHDTTQFPSEIYDINESCSDLGGPQWNIKIIDGKEILTTRDALMLAHLGIDNKDYIEVTPAELKRIESRRRRQMKKAEKVINKGG